MDVTCVECPAGSYGVNCESLCRCRDDSDCHPITGQCVCGAGWTGLACQHGEKTHDAASRVTVNPLTPTVAIWVELQSILCQIGLRRGHYLVIFDIRAL